MKSAICPKCFMQLNEEQWVYSCNNSDCKQNNKIAKLPAEVVKNRGAAPACPDCGSEYPSPLCLDCGFPLRIDDPDSATLAISLVGARGCGKSHFLSVMLEELKNEVAKAYDCVLFPLGGDDTIEIYDHQYYQPLYTRGYCLEPTDQSDVCPLIYSLVFQKERAVKTFNLTFYDSCGANFESIAAMADLNRSIYHSGGIMFLIDPGQLPSVGERQAAHGEKTCDADAVNILSRTIHVLRDGSGKKDLREKLDTPIAICLTKLDSIKTLLDPSSFVKTPSRHFSGSGFNKTDFEACNLEVQSIIESWGGGEFIRQITTQFSNYGFFAFSSLGSQPDDGGSIQHIAPHRITDPLMWLLWRKEII